MRVWLLAGLVLGACGKVYVNPVTLDAHSQPAAVMYVLDKSGSMAMPLPNGVGCGTCAFPTCNESTCPTRFGAVRAWSSRLLSELGNEARWGLTTFPADNVCTPAGADQVLELIPATVGAGTVASTIASVSLGGGTPTAASLAFVGQTFAADDAERIILLVTDGQPNCNAQNPNTCELPAACQCTLATSCGTMVNDNDPLSFCRRGCLDADGAVDAIATLTTFGVFTLVVGFGSDFSDPGTLNAMAQAGLDGQRCVSDSDCFGFLCGANGTCNGTALFASDAMGLDAVTQALGKKLKQSSHCLWSLDVDLPDGPTAIYFDAQKVAKSDWVVETPSRVRFLGDSCQQLLDDVTVVPTFFGEPRAPPDAG